MKREALGKRLDKVRQQIAVLQEEEQELSVKKQLADEEETMRIIKREKISPERLKMLNDISDQEIEYLLAQREKEGNQTDAKETDN